MRLKIGPQFARDDGPAPSHDIHSQLITLLFAPHRFVILVLIVSVFRLGSAQPLALFDNAPWRTAAAQLREFGELPQP
jgi:hypothetical protein